MRGVRNIIMVIIIILGVCSIVFTIYHRNNGRSNLPSIASVPDKSGCVTEGSNNIKSDYIYYVLFVVEGFIVCSLIIYLIMSSFNKRGFIEIFSNGDKVLVYILSVLLGTFVVCAFCSFIKFNNKSRVSYSASKTISGNRSINGGKYSSIKSNSNAIMVNGSRVNMKGITVTKSGNSSGDDSSFYGNNSGVLVKSRANINISGSKINTNGNGANGVFSYGSGSIVDVFRSTISTKGDSSGGIMVSGGGSLRAYDLDVSTKGKSSAAIRSDRGGGTIYVNNGTYKTTGGGSPAIYSTANVSVSSATLKSSSSEGIIIEGKNKVSLDDVKLTDTNKILNGKSTTYKNIFLYQSMSGDASSGIAFFKAKNSTITTNKGDSFYVTNTKGRIVLENNKINNNDSDGYFLRIQKDSWGKSGSNGGDVTLVLKEQKVSGDIYVDDISTLDMSISNGSSYTGTINGGAKKISINLSRDSTIKLTGDSYVSSLKDGDSSYSNIDFNGYKLYVDGGVIN